MIQNVAIIGAGTMGNGIAQVFAQSGFSVYVRDMSQEYLDRAKNQIQTSLDRLVKKEKISSIEKEATLKNLHFTLEAPNQGNIDLVVEAVPEIFDLKAKIFKELSSTIQKNALFASNTSSISVTKLAQLTDRPSKVIGMHFMNPVPVMKLIEVISGIATAPETTQQIMEISKKLGKIPIECKDSPGFISNRVLLPMINEAIFSLYEGVATREAIDEIMKLGMSHPMGPLTLADFIGLDVCLDIMNVLYDGFKDSKYRPCPLLVKMVEAKWLGRKTGKGFYDYPVETKS
ncbi:MAG: 3-hydroxybutyryl-CoA dehydrogenase [Planctomycetota bacterium]